MYAVGLQPHAALGLPAALGDPGLDLLIELGVALFQEVVQHGLAGHELVAGELLHELQHGGEGADDLLAGLGHGPPPGHVDVGVADAGGDDVLVACHLGVELLGQIRLGLGQSFIELGGVGQAHVEEVDGIVQHKTNSPIEFDMNKIAEQLKQNSVVLHNLLYLYT